LILLLVPELATGAETEDDSGKDILVFRVLE
jgi:hypothetical protein